MTTTAERAFELESELQGKLIAYQKSYNCNQDTSVHNGTAIIELNNGEKITVYLPCENRDLNLGTSVSIQKTKHNLDYWNYKREIYEPLPKSSEYYGEWICVSCRYRNTVGEIKISKNKRV